MNKVTVIVPMAGMGSRFAQEGYLTPKPFVDVNGEPMISRVVESLNYPAKYIFVCQKYHLCDGRREMLLSLSDDVEILEIDGPTEGAAISVAIAADRLYDSEIIIVNSDQLVHTNINNMVETARLINADGSILVFKSDGTNWSYAKVENGVVVEVKEKTVISNIATAGVYYWKRASDFVKSLEAMMEADDRHNNEFYVAPTYNYLIKSGGLVTVYLCDSVDQLGTPSELEEYLA